MEIFLSFDLIYSNVGSQFQLCQWQLQCHGFVLIDISENQWEIKLAHSSDSEQPCKRQLHTVLRCLSMHKHLQCLYQSIQFDTVSTCFHTTAFHCIPLRFTWITWDGLRVTRSHKTRLPRCRCPPDMVDMEHLPPSGPGQQDTLTQRSEVKRREATWSDVKKKRNDSTEWTTKWTTEWTTLNN